MKKKNKNIKSKKLFVKSFKYFPGGVASVRRSLNFIDREEYPVFLKKAKGCKVFDIDNNCFIDTLAAYGPIILGYREKLIDEAVINHLKKNGNCMTLTQPSQYYLTKLLCEEIPSAEKVLIVKSGSEGTSLAIRLARSFTGRNIILRCGYHGWHDWCVENKNGVPNYIYKDVKSFEFNNINSLEMLLKKNLNKVAAVIIWPVHTPFSRPVEMPKKNYLKQIRELTKKYKTLLIFDEIRTCFRFSTGGFQKKIGVVPDLTIVGKAMANGYPISAVVGSSEVMNEATLRVLVSSTYYPNSLEHIASIQTINFLKNKNILKIIEDKGNYLAKNVISLIKKYSFKINFSGYPLMPYFTFNENDLITSKKIVNIFYTSMIRSKVFMTPHHHSYIMYRHSQNDLNKILNSIDYSFNQVKKKL